MKKKNEEINELLNRDDLYIVHYSSQHLGDDNEGLSPRVTSIAVLDYKRNQMSSFAVHLIAEEMRLSKGNILNSFDRVETTMLERFFSFAESKGENAIWLHWNMKSANYGFEHLEHRYRALKRSEPYHIEEKNRYNLSQLLDERYGENYAKKPKMLNLMELNGGKHRDFLTGEEEVTAFRAKEFVKVHKSTVCKVYFFADVLRKASTNKLRTETNRLKYKINEFYQNPIVQIIGILGIIGSIVSLIMNLFNGN